VRAELHLEDGTVFAGEPFGARVPCAGEVVFNTGMVGYPETLTDPSYAGQILACTYPLIGNYGVPGPDGNGSPEGAAGLPPWFESTRVHVRGFIVSGLSRTYSHWSARSSLDAWLRAQGVPGIAGIDTRALTRRLREKGTMLGKILVDGADVPLEDPNATNLVAGVSIGAPVLYEAPGPLRCVLVDFGAKHNIIRSLTRRGVSVLRVPWNYDWTGEEADGVVLSNGPGDPVMCAAAIDVLRRGLEKNIPVLGICLGHQLLALAAGGDTYKMRFGHRSQNQPCVQVGSRRCYVTSQNHGFAVNERSLPPEWEPWFFNANDGTNEGIRHRTKPFRSVQFHPEATPGPTDTDGFFDSFIEVLAHEGQAA